MAATVSQVELVCAILKHLDRQGCKDATPRQMNAVIEAANLVVAALASDDTVAAPGAGLAAWWADDDGGLSSQYMASELAKAAGLPGRWAEPCEPADAADFGRCARLLDVAPELRPHLAAMRACGARWAALVGEWDALEALYREGKGTELTDRIGGLTRLFEGR